MSIKRYEIDPLTGALKVDGPEDHAMAMDAAKRLGMKSLWGKVAGNSPATANEIQAYSAPMQVGPGTGPRFRKLLDTFKSFKPNISRATIREYETVVTEFEAKFDFISITEMTTHMPISVSVLAMPMNWSSKSCITYDQTF